jgi:hypothetical protein
MPTLQASFSDRRSFGAHLAHKGLVGVAAEIGTHRGQFAYEFLSGWPGRRLYCVDHWMKNYDATDPAAIGDRAADEMAARSLMATFPKERVTILRMASMEARLVLSNLDFVYLDADHRPDRVYEDILGWWPLIVPGGILAGHDYICPGEPYGGWGANIQLVVNDFAHQNNLMVYLVTEPMGLPWSWWVQKPTEEEGQVLP